MPNRPLNCNHLADERNRLVGEEKERHNYHRRRREEDHDLNDDDLHELRLLAMERDYEHSRYR